MVCDQAVDGVLPAIFEKSNPGYSSRILPAVEGCVYPLYFVKTGFAGCTLEQVYATPSEKRMFEVLKEHTRNLLLDPERRNLFADGGIKLSSTSNNSWMSKISIFMHVTRKVFHLDADPEIAEVFSAGGCCAREVADRRQFVLGLLRPDRLRRRQGQPLLSANHHQRAVDGVMRDEHLDPIHSPDAHLFARPYST